MPLVDAGLEGDTPWLAMEHLACPTLDMRLREGGLLPLDEATALVRALADAVDTAHAHGLDHGSLHPRDVFLPPKAASSSAASASPRPSAWPACVRRGGGRSPRPRRWRRSRSTRRPIATRWG